MRMKRPRVVRGDEPLPREPLAAEELREFVRPDLDLSAVVERVVRDLEAFGLAGPAEDFAPESIWPRRRRPGNA